MYMYKRSVAGNFMLSFELVSMMVGLQVEHLPPLVAGR